MVVITRINGSARSSKQDGSGAGYYGSDVTGPACAAGTRPLSHLVGIPRRPVVARRQPRHTGAASGGNDADRELLGAVLPAQGPGISRSGRPTARWRPRAAAPAPPVRPHACLDAVVPGRRHPLSRSPRPVRSDTTSSAPDRTPDRRGAGARRAAREGQRGPAPARLHPVPKNGRNRLSTTSQWAANSRPAIAAALYRPKRKIQA